MTQKEAIALFNSIESLNSSHSLSDLAVFRLVYRCGLRASEISLLKFEDCNMDKGEIYCKRLKGSNNNTIRLDEKTKHILNKYINKNGTSSISQILFKSQKNSKR